MEATQLKPDRLTIYWTFQSKPILLNRRASLLIRHFSSFKHKIQPERRSNKEWKCQLSQQIQSNLSRSSKLGCYKRAALITYKDGNIIIALPAIIRRILQRDQIQKGEGTQNQKIKQKKFQFIKKNYKIYITYWIYIELKKNKEQTNNNMPITRKLLYLYYSYWYSKILCCK